MRKRIRLLSDEERARRATRGRPFANGNPGRKPGSKNRSTLVAEALLSDEKDELLRKAIELAKAGDVQMLKFLLERTLPKERSVRVELPPTVGDFDAVAAMEAILVAATTGQILPIIPNVNRLDIDAITKYAFWINAITIPIVMLTVVTIRKLGTTK